MVDVHNNVSKYNNNNNTNKLITHNINTTNNR